ncbi:TonB-dependent receptor [Anaeromyxobacter sp. Red801]|uniref:TonB-dependent receptor n=1 Tax=Anaeromyxobacter sp. Red801 TaxID=3411632 RepID=UPI003BA2A717
MSRNWKLARLVAALTLLPAPGAAEEPAAEPRTEVLLEEIVVKSRREPRADGLEVREVRETPARDLGEALEQGLGVGKVRKAGIASDVVLRGLKRDDVNVLVDGTRTHGACPSRMDPPAFHLDWAEVDGVEVRRGPFDVSQPGGLGGVVDVRTRGARPGPGAEVNLGAGSFGATESSAVASYGGGRASLLLGGAFKRSDPYLAGDGRNITEVIPATSTGRYRDTSDHQTAYDVRSGWAKVGLVPAEGQQLELGYTRQEADDVLYPYLLMDGIRDDTDRVNATWRAGALGPLASARAQLYWTRVAHDMDDRDRCSSAADPAACAGGLAEAWSMRTEARTRTLGAKLEAGLGGAGAALEARIGADLVVRNWDNETIRVRRAMPGQPYVGEASIPDVTQTTGGVYAELRRALAPSVRATAGARLDVAESYAGVDRRDFYATWRPDSSPERLRTDLLLAGNVQLDWDAARGLTVFAGYGHGTRLPDPQERYMALAGLMGKPAWVGDPSLRPTRSDELDAGLRFTADRLLAKAQVFHAWLADEITLVPLALPSGATAKTYAGVSARRVGGEASARLALPLRLYAGAAVAYVWARNETAGTPLAEIPPLRASASLRWDDGRFFAEAEEQWAARQDRVDPALGERPTSAWFITNLRAGAEWRGLKAFLGVRNLLDKTYAEHLSYLRDPFAAGVKVPEPGRTLYANLQYAF